MERYFVIAASTRWPHARADLFTGRGAQQLAEDFARLQTKTTGLPVYVTRVLSEAQSVNNTLSFTRYID